MSDHVWSTAEMAALLGLTKNHVTKLAGEGIIPKLAYGKYGPEAVTAYCDYARAAARSGGVDFQAERARLTKLRADREALDLRVAEGELVELERVKKTVFERARLERDQHLNWPARISAQLAAELGACPRATFGALDREMRDHLAGLADTRLEDLAT